MIQDTFNRASLGAAWETVEGTAWTIASSLYLKPAGQYQQTAVREVGTFPANQYAEVWTEVPSGAGDASSGHGPAVRIGATGDCYFVAFALTILTLYRRVAGVNTYLTDSGTYAALSADTFYKIKLVVTGTSLEVFLNDVSKCTATNSVIAAGNPGCHVLTGQTSLFPRFDDFASTDLTVASFTMTAASTQAALSSLAATLAALPANYWRGDLWIGDPLVNFPLDGALR